MAEERPAPPFDKRGHYFEPGPFTLDLYRLVSLVLADKGLTKLGYDRLLELKDEFLRSEVTRILISIAVALRIEFDQADPRTGAKLLAAHCGKLYPNWPARKNEVLTLREACNKIIHAKKLRFDIVTPDAAHNYDEEGVYLSSPNLFLYGKKEGKDWRAKLSVIDFAEAATTVFFVGVGRS